MLGSSLFTLESGGLPLPYNAKRLINRHTMSDFSEELAGLVVSAREGDADAQEELLRQFYPSLRAYVRSRMDPELRQRESASDVVQSTCREVLRGIGEFEFRNDQAFRKWLFTVAQNKVREKGRFHRAERRRPDREASSSEFDGLASVYARFATPSQAAGAGEFVERLESALDRLNEDQREVITLVRIVGLSTAEAAEQIGRTEDATRSLLARSLARLSTLLLPED